MMKWNQTATAGLLLALISTCIVVINEYEFLPPLLKFIYGVLFVFIGFIVLRIAAAYFRDLKKNREHTLMQRVKQTLESTQLPETPNSDSILYLRPFKADDQYMAAVEYGGDQYNSVEAVICQMVEESGRPVAIGKPGEDIQPLGAHRVYASDQEWKDKVSSFFETAKYVILYVDFTPGVTWEIETALSRYKDKLILIPKVYNQHETLFRKIAVFEPTFLLYPFYSLWVNHFSNKTAHRGNIYYQEWNQLMSQHMPNVKMNDKVSAVIFENGNAVPFFAEKPTQEAQLLAIHQAIRTKLALPSHPPVFIPEGEKPLLKIRADLGMTNAQYAYLYPCAMGTVEFYREGLRYNSFYNSFRFNLLFREQFRSSFRYRKDELIPYSKIREVRLVNDSCIRLILREANGSISLSVPQYHQGCIWMLKQHLEHCLTDKCFNDAHQLVLQRYYEQQSADYVQGLCQMEAASLILSVVLGLLSSSMAAAYIAMYFLSLPWNVTMALLSFIYTHGNDNRSIRLIGIAAAVFHIVYALTLA